MARTDVTAIHVWADGSTTQFIINTKAFPDGLETLKDIAECAVVGLAATLQNVLEIAYEAADETD